MLTPSQFAQRWQDEVVAKDALPEDLRLVSAKPEHIDLSGLSEPTQRFLTEAGLPKSCAPFLCFEEIGKGLPRVWEVYSPGQWRPGETERLGHFRMIGSDGAGNPLCIDQRNDQRRDCRALR